MEIDNFTTSAIDADIFKLEFDDSIELQEGQVVQTYGNQLYLHIPEYQQYYDKGYTIKEYHPYRKMWAVKQNLLGTKALDNLMTCVYIKHKSKDVLDILPHKVKTAHFQTYIEDGCIVAEIPYEMYKNFRRDVKDIVEVDGKFIFSHIGTKKFNEIVETLAEDGFTKPILMQPMDFNYYPLDSSTILTIACALKVPSLPMKFLRRRTNKDIEELFIGNAMDVMTVNYDIDVDIDFTADIRTQPKSTYRFFIADFDKLVVNDDDHTDYIQQLCKDEVQKFSEEHNRMPSDFEQYGMLEGKNHVRGYISDEYHEFGLDIMFDDNRITKDGLEILDKLNDDFSTRFRIDKYLFDWKTGFKMSESYAEFRKSITSSKYYLPIWKNTQYT